MTTRRSTTRGTTLVLPGPLRDAIARHGLSYGEVARRAACGLTRQQIQQLASAREGKPRRTTAKRRDAIARALLMAPASLSDPLHGRSSDLRAYFLRLGFNEYEIAHTPIGWTADPETLAGYRGIEALWPHVGGPTSRNKPLLLAALWSVLDLANWRRAFGVESPTPPTLQEYRDFIEHLTAALSIAWPANSPATSTRSLSRLMDLLGAASISFESNGPLAEDMSRLLPITYSRELSPRGLTNYRTAGARRHK